MLIGCVVFFASVTGLFFLSVNIESRDAVRVKKLQYNQMAVTRSAVAATMIGFSVVALFSVLLLHVIKPRQVLYLLSDPFTCLNEELTITDPLALYGINSYCQGHFIGERAHQLDRPRLL